MADDRPLYSSPAPPDAWGDGLQLTGLFDANGCPIYRKRACGFGSTDRYVIFTETD